MTQNKLYKLMDLVEDIKKLDGIIQIHSQDKDDNIMLSQYEAKKIKLVSLLIAALNKVPSKTSYLELQIIAKLLEKFVVHDKMNNKITQNKEFIELQNLVEVI